jgi:queuosine precursor transporter
LRNVSNENPMPATSSPRLATPTRADPAAEHPHWSKETRLLVILAAIIVASACIAEVISVKLFQLRVYSWIGVNYPFTLTAGSLVWPLVFLTTDTINEFYGRRAVKFISWTTVAMVLWMFVILTVAIQIPAASFCKVRDPEFGMVFGQSIWIIIGSVCAFLVSQLVDVTVFHKIRRALRGRYIWARATGSTIVSQLIDSFIVIYIAFYLPNFTENPSSAYDAGTCFVMSRDSFVYKVGFAIALTPLIYGAHWVVHRWLGPENARRLSERAASGD